MPRLASPPLGSAVGRDARHHVRSSDAFADRGVGCVKDAQLLVAHYLGHPATAIGQPLQPPATSKRAEGAEPIRQRVQAADGSENGSWSRPRRRRSSSTGMSASAATSCKRLVAAIQTLLASAMIADGVPSRTASSIIARSAASSAG